MPATDNVETLEQCVGMCLATVASRDTTQWTGARYFLVGRTAINLDGRHDLAPSVSTVLSQDTARSCLRDL
jgi:hypothetical protein